MLLFYGGVLQLDEASFAIEPIRYCALFCSVLGCYGVQAL